MGLSRYKRNRFRLHVLDSGTARTGQFESVDPQHEQTIEGHKLGFVRVLARLGRTTSNQQWRLNGLRVCDTRMSCICLDAAQVSSEKTFSTATLMALREATED